MYSKGYLNTYISHQKMSQLSVPFILSLVQDDSAKNSAKNVRVQVQVDANQSSQILMPGSQDKAPDKVCQVNINAQDFSRII